MEIEPEAPTAGLIYSMQTHHEPNQRQCAITRCLRHAIQRRHSATECTGKTAEARHRCRGIGVAGGPGGARRVLAAVQVRQPLQHLPRDRRQHVLRDRLLLREQRRPLTSPGKRRQPEVRWWNPSGDVRMEVYVLSMRAGGQKTAEQ